MALLKQLMDDAWETGYEFAVSLIDELADLQTLDSLHTFIASLRELLNERSGLERLETGADGITRVGSMSDW